jgi:hypothetical protein
MGPPARTVEEKLALMAAKRHGVVTRAQLLDAGVTPKEIRSRAQSGALLREHRGVYGVGHRAPSVEATYLAAVFAAGDGAVLSGRGAAHLWGSSRGRLRRRSSSPPPNDALKGSGRSARGGSTPPM